RPLRRRHPRREGGAEPAHHEPAPQQAAPGRHRLGAPRRPPQLLHGRGSARALPRRADLRAHRARRLARPRSPCQGPSRMIAAPDTSPPPAQERVDLRKFAWLSIVAAILTITLKTGAWVMTDSVGLLSDAAESTVNLVAAVVALIALTVAARPATERFLYGRAKAEYFSAAVEGLMMFAAAAVILVTAVERFLNPRPLENLGMGLVIVVLASLINGGVSVVLLRAGKEHNSIALRADGKHLMADVVASAGVLLGVALVALTGWERLDALVAFAVGVNI